MLSSDRRLDVLLTVLALALLLDASARFFAPSPAQASGTVTCRIENPVEVRGTLKIDTFASAISIKAEQTLPVEVKR